MNAPPDDFILRKIDEALIWLHSYGIKRLYVMLALAALLFIAEMAIYYVKGRLPDFQLFVTLFFVGTTVVMDQSRLKSSGARAFNMVQEFIRSGPLGWIRAGIIFTNLAIVFWSFPTYIDGPLWALWLWLICALVPTEPPKRKLRDLLEVRRLQPEGV